MPEEHIPAEHLLREQPLAAQRTRVGRQQAKPQAEVAARSRVARQRAKPSMPEECILAEHLLREQPLAAAQRTQVGRPRERTPVVVRASVQRNLAGRPHWA